VTAAIYHAALVQRAKAAIGKGRIAQPTVSVTLDNPLCGDRVTLDVMSLDGHLSEIRHHVRGCLLCEAAAATIAESCQGKSIQTVRAIMPAIRSMMQDGGVAPASWPMLEIFSPVHDSKSRRDCVLLPFTALDQALDRIDQR
jgi:NifU-like protein involved in Fe-S cluster formation